MDDLSPKYLFHSWKTSEWKQDIKSQMLPSQMDLQPEQSQRLNFSMKNNL